MQLVHAFSRLSNDLALVNVGVDALDAAAFAEHIVIAFDKMCWLNCSENFCMAGDRNKVV